MIFNWPSVSVVNPMRFWQYLQQVLEQCDTPAHDGGDPNHDS